MRFDATLIKFQSNINHRKITILSNGETIELKHPQTDCNIFSVIDSNGVIVRSIHNLLANMVFIIKFLKHIFSNHFNQVNE
jgi:hypothetical protein